MMVTTRLLLFDPESIAGVLIHRQDGAVTGARVLFKSGQEVDLHNRPEWAQELLDYFSSDKNSTGTTAATSEP